MSVLSNYSGQQIENMMTYLAIGRRLGASKRAIQAAFVAGFGENSWHTYGCNSSGHCGTWQISSSWQSSYPAHPYWDVGFWTAYAYSNGFYGHGGLIAIANNDPNLSPGWIAELCQGAGPTDAAAAAYYEGYLGDADGVLAALGEGVIGVTSNPPSPIGTGPVGSAVGPYDPTPQIDDAFTYLYEHSRRGKNLSNAAGAWMSDIKYVTPEGPVYAP